MAFKINKYVQATIRKHFAKPIHDIQPMGPINGVFEFQRDVTITYEDGQMNNYRLTCENNTVTKTVKILSVQDMPAPDGGFDSPEIVQQRILAEILDREIETPPVGKLRRLTRDEQIDKEISEILGF